MQRTKEMLVAKSWTDGAPQPVVLKEHAQLKDPLSYKIKRAFLGGALKIKQKVRPRNSLL